MDKASKKRLKDAQEVRGSEDIPLSSPNSQNRMISQKTVIRGRKNSIYYLAGLISLITFIVYLLALQNELVLWDDDYNVTNNPYIRSLDFSFFKWAFLDFSAPGADYWRPLSYLSHALDYAVWGLDPLGHHLTNNILHAVNTFVVVLLVVRLMEGSKSSLHSSPTTHYSPLTTNFSPFTLIAAATTGLLFGLHPLHVESVAWVSERKDLLCALFYLLSVMSYIKYAKAVSQPPAPSSYSLFTIHYSRPYVLSLSFFILALMSKPMAVSLPVVLLILDWYPFKRIHSIKSLQTVFVEKLPFMTLSLVSSLVTVLAQKELGAFRLMEYTAPSTRVLVAARSLITYLWKMICPLNLVPYYPYPKYVSIASLEYLSALVLTAVITVVCLVVAKKQKLLLSAWAYYILTLVPVLGLIQVGGQSMANRYTYLPSLAPFLVAGILVAHASAKTNYLKRGGMGVKLFGVTMAIFVLLSLTTLTYRQIKIWKNSVALWTYVIEKDPANIPEAYNNRGLAFFINGEVDKAIRDYHQAIAINSQYPEAHSNLGIALSRKGLQDEAIREFEISIRSDPEFANAHRNLAPALYKSGRIAEAIEHYLIVTRLRPYDAVAHADLGSAYGALGSYDKAIEHFQIALRLRPDFADAHFNLGIAYQAKGMMDQAIEQLEAAARLSPEDAAIRNDLERAYILKESAVRPDRLPHTKEGTDRNQR